MATVSSVEVQVMQAPQSPSLVELLHESTSALGLPSLQFLGGPSMD